MEKPQLEQQLAKMTVKTVVKRSGAVVEYNIEKVRERLRAITSNEDIVTRLVAATANRIPDGMQTRDIDDQVARTSAMLAFEDEEYEKVAIRLAVSSLHRDVPSSLYWSFQMFGVDHYDQDAMDFISQYRDTLENAIDHELDYGLTYFGFCTIKKMYLARRNGVIIERPQHVIMRMCITLYLSEWKRLRMTTPVQTLNERYNHLIAQVLENYTYMSQGYFTHATPSLISASHAEFNPASCFLLSIEDASKNSILETLVKCNTIFSRGGGIGLALHQVRGGEMLQTLRLCNSLVEFARSKDRRPSVMAVYLEPWHQDIYKFIQIRRNNINESDQARQLFNAIWMCDLFMRRVHENESWTLFCPEKAPNLANVYGDEFEQLYTLYERQNVGTMVVNARDLWRTIITAQTETGTPYILYKDACNSKSNQCHVGASGDGGANAGDRTIIKCSNLCAEIVEFSGCPRAGEDSFKVTSPEEIGVCNLASLALPKFVGHDGLFNFEKLNYVTRLLVRNLNQVIGEQRYSLEATRLSNFRYRPIGIGVQGLADTFLKMRIPFTSSEGRRLNMQIFENIYFAALNESCQLAKECGAPYPAYESSRMHLEGALQQDLWSPQQRAGLLAYEEMCPWSELRQEIARYGVLNSLLIALMPTSTTSQILGNSESIEPYTSNLYIRKTQSGDFIQINRYLMADLKALGLWTEQIRTEIIRNNGSVQNIDSIPRHIKELYRIVWEIDQKELIQMAAERGRYVDQSQSMSLYVDSPTIRIMTDLHFLGWSFGLKTGMYYLRTKPGAMPQRVTIDTPLSVSAECVDDVCIACSS